MYSADDKITLALKGLDDDRQKWKCANVTFERDELIDLMFACTFSKPKLKNADWKSLYSAHDKIKLALERLDNETLQEEEK